MLKILKYLLQKIGVFSQCTASLMDHNIDLQDKKFFCCGHNMTAIVENRPK
jgi:hypothetical protein